MSSPLADHAQIGMKLILPVAIAEHGVKHGVSFGGQCLPRRHKIMEIIDFMAKPYNSWSLAIFILIRKTHVERPIRCATHVFHYKTLSALRYAFFLTRKEIL